jgi:hypothetical protein
MSPRDVRSPSSATSASAATASEISPRYVSVGVNTLVSQRRSLDWRGYVSVGVNATKERRCTTVKRKFVFFHLYYISLNGQNLLTQTS